MEKTFALLRAIGLVIITAAVMFIFIAWMRSQEQEGGALLFFGGIALLLGCIAGQIIQDVRSKRVIVPEIIPEILPERQPTVLDTFDVR